MVRQGFPADAPQNACLDTPTLKCNIKTIIALSQLVRMPRAYITMSLFPPYSVWIGWFACDISPLDFSPNVFLKNPLSRFHNTCMVLQQTLYTTKFLKSRKPLDSTNLQTTHFGTHGEETCRTEIPLKRSCDDMDYFWRSKVKACFYTHFLYKSS